MFTHTHIHLPEQIGGYAGGNPADPAFRELIVRWFQFGVLCPIFRQRP